MTKAVVVHSSVLNSFPSQADLVVRHTPASHIVSYSSPHFELPGGEPRCHLFRFRTQPTCMNCPCEHKQDQYRNQGERERELSQRRTIQREREEEES